MKEVLQPSLHVLELARSSTRDGAPLPGIPKMANGPLIAAAEAAEEVEMFILDRGYRIIRRE